MKSLLCSLATIVAAGCISSASARPNTVQVNVFSFDFSVNLPGQPIMDPVIHVGDTIHWVWLNGTHSVTSVDGLAESFSSDISSPPYSFNYTFTQVGTFPYYCLVHGFDQGDGTAGGMSGTVTVMPVPSCPADWNHDGRVGSQDFFDFLSDFFNHDADFNGDMQTNSQDLFDFLAAFFVPCQP